ncbi:MAG TPA: ribosome-associated translation inhibitor RaiA [bacterium]
MRINITARRFKLSNGMKRFTEEEVSRLQKYYDGIVDAEVVLSWEKHDRIAEINMSVFGNMLTALGRSEDMKKSVYEAVEKMERQLLKYKGKIRGFSHERAVAEAIKNA